MRDPAIQAELVKLARLLETEPETIDYLSHLEADRLHVLRTGLSDALFEKFRSSFSGLARLSSLLPSAVSARIAEHVMGPILSGRIAGELPPSKVLDLASRQSDAFLAETCLHMDPQRSAAIIAEFPVERAVALTRLLLEKRELITMARFVDFLPHGTLAATTAATEDAADLLQISFFVEKSEKLDIVIDILDHKRRESLIHAAAEHDLWPEVLSTLLRLEHGRRVIIAELAMRQGGDTLASLIHASAEEDLWPALLQLADEISAEGVATLGRQPAFHEANTIRSLIDSVVANDLWAAFRRQLPRLGDDTAIQLIDVAGRDRSAFIWELDRRVEPGGDDLKTLEQTVAQLEADSRDRIARACDGGALAALLNEASGPPR